jgi:RNA polymerase sigma-70 factor (ECF subfamily)
MSNDSSKAADDTADERGIAALLRGDDEAFVALYRRRRDDVYRFAFAMTRSRTFAQDATQEVFLRVLEHAARYDARRGPVKAWLLGLARHVVIDRLRAESRLSFEAEEAAAPCDNEQSVLMQQRVARLHDAIARLPLEYREALVLCELHELSYAACAAALACPVGTVRSRLHRGRALLTAMLKESEPEAPRPIAVAQVPRAGAVDEVSLTTSEVLP